MTESAVLGFLGEALTAATTNRQTAQAASGAGSHAALQQPPQQRGVVVVACSMVVLGGVWAWQRVASSPRALVLPHVAT